MAYEDDGVEACDMAIKALEKEPCEDCVSRQAVLDMTTVIETDDYSGNEIMEVVDTDDIKALPSVTPTKCIATVKFSKEDMQKLIDEKMKEIVVERKKGEWKYSGSYDVEGMLYCSCCKHEIDVSEGHFKFCPNCGAEMEVVKE